MSSEEYSVPDFKRWNDKKIYDYDTQVFDYETLEDLNRNITKARVALFDLTSKINLYERKEREAQVEYDRAWRRYYITATDKTDSLRKAKADLACEELEDKVVVFQQLKKELSRMSSTLRVELDTMQTIGNNLRQQMKL